jgi:cytochrome c-type protein NapB
MKIKILLVGTLLIIIGIVGCQTNVHIDSGMDRLSVGIGEDGVFNDPSPIIFNYPTTKAGESDRMAKSYHTAPPMIPHIVDKYLPITMENNECMDCHDKPKLIGREYVKGKKLAMPANHYGGFDGRGDEDEVSGARYICSQCHTPVSDAKTLVKNTF